MIGELILATDREYVVRYMSGGTVHDVRVWASDPLAAVDKFRREHVDASILGCYEVGSILSFL